MDLGLCHKRVLVTGASRGIGAAIAKQFLDEDADVMIISRGSEGLFENEKKLQNEYGASRISAEVCDCTSPQSLLQLRDKLRKKWGGIDVVIANVGDGRSVPDSLPNDEQWKKIWVINFESALCTARTFLPMLQNSNGCLLFVSSIAAMEVIGAPVDYSAAKSAVVALAKNMARKLAQEVRVNVLAPGNVYFPGGSWDEKIQKNPERIANIIESTVPMNRFGTPEEMAYAAVFLCSKRAEFITGSVLVVDGGQTVGIF